VTALTNDGSRKDKEMLLDSKLGMFLAKIGVSTPGSGIGEIFKFQRSYVSCRDYAGRGRRTPRCESGGAPPRLIYLGLHCTPAAMRRSRIHKSYVARRCGKRGSAVSGGDCEVSHVLVGLCTISMWRGVYSGLRYTAGASGGVCRGFPLLK
jgi:hypothetical protein